VAGLLSQATRKQVALANPAVNGYTTLDLIAKELNYLDGKPDVVTVLIGVNDLVQNRSVEEYRASLRQIYDRIGRLGLPAGRVAASRSRTGRLCPPPPSTASRSSSKPSRTTTTRRLRKRRWSEASSGSTSRV